MGNRGGNARIRVEMQGMETEMWDIKGGNAWNQGGNTGIQILDLIEILKYLKVFYKDFAR